MIKHDYSALFKTSIKPIMIEGSRFQLRQVSTRTMGFLQATAQPGMASIDLQKIALAHSLLDDKGNLIFDDDEKIELMGDIPVGRFLDMIDELDKHSGLNGLLFNPVTREEDDEDEDDEDATIETAAAPEQSSTSNGAASIPKKKIARRASSTTSNPSHS